MLHLGCTNWPYTSEAIENKMLLHFELEKMAGELYGFDYDQRGLDVLADAGAKNLYRADLEKLDDLDLNETFDVIVAGEMIEHLNNPGLFLKGIRAVHERRHTSDHHNDQCILRNALRDIRIAGQRRHG